MSSTTPLSIIDSHVHFWNPEKIGYDWLAAVPAIGSAHFPDDLAQQASSLNLEGIVFVEAGCNSEQSLAEVDWITSLAEHEPRIQGIVAFAPLELGEAVREHLAALAERPLVKGIRRMIQSEAAGFSIQPTFVEGVKLLPEYGFSFDICTVHHQLGDVLTLVDQCPDVSFVADHISKPDIKAGLMEPWATQITELAAYPNVECKISGLATEADREAWTREDLKPYIDHVIGAFGIDRVMYGGDWPVSLLATTYTDWVEILAWATADLGAEAQEKLFSRNAQRFYRVA
jgi:L-fuconolactonase